MKQTVPFPPESQAELHERIMTYDELKRNRGTQATTATVPTLRGTDAEISALGSSPASRNGSCRTH